METGLSKYEWSPSGLRLLDIIENSILRLGGNNRAADILENEWAKGYRFIAIKYGGGKRNGGAPWSPEEIAYVIKNQHLKNHEIAFDMPGRTIFAVEQQIIRLRRKNLVGRKRK